MLEQVIKIRVLHTLQNPKEHSYWVCVCTYTILINMLTLPLKSQLDHIPLVIR